MAIFNYQNGIPIQKAYILYIQFNYLFIAYTVETIIRAAALIKFYYFWGLFLLSKMRLLIEVRLLFEGGSY